jgi:hypothetical protein
MHIGNLYEHRLNLNVTRAYNYHRPMSLLMLIKFASFMLSGMKELEFLFVCLIYEALCVLWVHVAVCKLQIIKLKLLGLCGRLKVHQAHY